MRCALALALAALVAGCLDQTDHGGAWTDATAIADLGPERASDARDNAPCTVRVVSWNVKFGADPVALAAALRAAPALANADVILLQEIEAYPDEDTSRTARFATALDMTWVYTPARDKGEGTHGLATLSRHPLMRPRVRELPFFDHLIRPVRRIATMTDVVLGDRVLAVSNVHLDVRLGVVDRIRQLDPVVQGMPAHALLGGDFNSGPWAWLDALVPLLPTQAIVGQDQATVLDDYLGANDLAPALDPGVGTLRVPVVDVRIDNLYARGMSFAGAGVVHVEGSDHWPIWADIDTCGL